MRFKGLCRWIEHVLEHLLVLVIAAPGRQGNIHRISLPSPCTTLRGSTGSWIEGELMRAEKQHAGIILKDVLGTIAMMHVPIHNQDALQPIPLLCVTRRNGNIV